jgi:hypothetical protein
MELLKIGPEEKKARGIFSFSIPIHGFYNSQTLSKLKLNIDFNFSFETIF